MGGEVSVIGNSVSGSFLEPLSGARYDRTGDAPLSQWMSEQPNTPVGLSTIEAWQEGTSTLDNVNRIQSEIRQQIQPANAFGSLSSVSAQVSSQFNGIKIGYEMGRVAAQLEARMEANPQLTTPRTMELASELRERGIAMSYGAALEATADAYSFNFNGKCYPNADALARAVNYADRTVAYELTPEMQKQQQIAEMDRQVMDSYVPGLGYSYGQTAYMYARGNGADIDGLRRAHALGTAGDALLGMAGSVAATRAARSGMALPGGQAQIRSEFVPTNNYPPTQRVQNSTQLITGSTEKAIPLPKSSTTIAGGGAKTSNLSPGDIVRIQNAANRTDTTITVVGSRANGTAGANSDWDFVLPKDTPRSTRRSLSSSLPEGPRGIGEPRNQDFFMEPIDTTKPHISFPPRK